MLLVDRFGPWGLQDMNVRMNIGLRPFNKVDNEESLYMWNNSLIKTLEKEKQDLLFYSEKYSRSLRSDI